MKIKCKVYRITTVTDILLQNFLVFYSKNNTNCEIDLFCVSSAFIMCFGLLHFHPVEAEANYTLLGMEGTF